MDRCEPAIADVQNVLDRQTVGAAALEFAKKALKCNMKTPIPAAVFTTDRWQSKQVKAYVHLELQGVLIKALPLT